MTTHQESLFSEPRREPVDIDEYAAGVAQGAPLERDLTHDNQVRRGAGLPQLFPTDDGRLVEGHELRRPAESATTEQAFGVGSAAVEGTLLPGPVGARAALDKIGKKRRPSLEERFWEAHTARVNREVKGK